MRNRSKAVLLQLVLVFFAQAFVCAQERTETVFSAKSEFVVVPVRVTDRAGLPVNDLTRGDFVLFDNGKKQIITAFEPPQTVEPPAAEPVEGQTEFSNLDDRAPRHLTIIVLDPQNTSFEGQSTARDGMLRFLAKAILTHRPFAVVVFRHGGFEIVCDFSDNRAVLRTALERARASANFAPIEELAADAAGTVPLQVTKSADLDAQVSGVLRAMNEVNQRLEEHVYASYTADSFRALARHFRPLPGHKAVLWISDGFKKSMSRPVLAGTTQSADSGAGTRTDNWDAAFRALADANMSVYPVDARGLVAIVPDYSLHGAAQVAHAQAEGVEEVIDTFRWVADETGGRAAYNGNDIAHAIERSVNDSATSYVLYYRAACRTSRAWHQIKVSALRDGIRLSARPGYYCMSADPENLAGQLQAELASPFSSTALPFLLRWKEVRDGSGGTRIVDFQIALRPGSLVVDRDRNNHVALEIAARPLDAVMKPQGEFRRTVQADLSPESLRRFETGGFSYSSQLQLPPGTYTVKFVILDKVGGQIGSLSAPLIVR